MRNSIALIIILLFSLSACKQNTKNDSNSASHVVQSPVKAKSVANIPGPLSSVLLRDKGQALIDYRREHSESKSVQIIDNGVWEFVLVFDGDKMHKPSKDVSSWIDFKLDGTFDYGKGSKVVTTGQYHFDLDKLELVILDDDKAIGPNVWSVKLTSSAMVWLGNAELTNNGYQIKLEYLDERPK